MLLDGRREGVPSLSTIGCGRVGDAGVALWRTSAESGVIHSVVHDWGELHSCNPARGGFGVVPSEGTSPRSTPPRSNGRRPRCHTRERAPARHHHAGAGDARGATRGDKPAPDTTAQEQVPGAGRGVPGEREGRRVTGIGVTGNEPVTRWRTSPPRARRAPRRWHRAPTSAGRSRRPCRSRAS